MTRLLRQSQSLGKSIIIAGLGQDDKLDRIFVRRELEKIASNLEWGLVIDSCVIYCPSSLLEVISRSLSFSVGLTSGFVQQGIELVDCPGIEAADAQKYYCTWQALKVGEESQSTFSSVLSIFNRQFFQFFIGYSVNFFCCMQIRNTQAADGVLAVVDRNLDDDESVVLFLEDAGSAASHLHCLAVSALKHASSRPLGEDADADGLFGVDYPHPERGQAGHDCGSAGGEPERPEFQLEQSPGQR